MLEKNKQIVALVIVVFLILGFFYTHFEFHFHLYPHIDTFFAKDFTREKFKQLQRGASEEEVVLLLGEPLSKGVTYGSDRNCWTYSGDGAAPLYFDFSYYMYLVCFNDEKVISKPVQEIFN